MTGRGPSGLGRLRGALASSTLARRRPRSRLAITLVAGLVVLVAATTIGRSVLSSPAPQPKSAAAPSAAADPPGYVRFRDAKAGFSIAYPQSWSRAASSDSEVQLLVTQGRARSLLVRVAPVGLEVTSETLPVVRDLTDSLVRADGRVQLLGEPQPVALDGLPGYRYVYTFETSSGQSGAHVHYFLFKDQRIITLVLQTLPAQRLEQDLPLVKRIAQTFRGRVL